jgi:hypothetical protein
MTLQMTVATLVAPLAMLALTACFIENTAYRRKRAAQRSTPQR